jgi:carbonic anhydrase
MLFQSLFLAAAFVPSVLSCPGHNNFRRSTLQGRQADPTDGTNSTKNDWAYEASFNWGRVNPAYKLCTHSCFFQGHLELN